MRRRVFFVGMLLAFAAAVGGAQPAAFRYVDPSQLALPAPYYSLSRQPWRSYLEATPAATYLNGLGVVWGGSVPGKSDAQVAAELAWAGFHRVRIEVPWSAMRWDEGAWDADFAVRFASILEALKASGLRPLILLNANHGAPCPLRIAEWQLASAARAGDRDIQVHGSTEGIVPQFSMVASLSSSAHAGPLVIAVSADHRLLTLSRPLAAALPEGTRLRIARLKYQPLFPVGTAQFDATSKGWLAYVAYVIRFVNEVYGADFDLEMWNELTFGSDFLDINHYFDPRLTSASADFLQPGGTAWELARRTQVAVAQLCPRCRLIWGFSNTTFFHTAVTSLPPGFSGQSYHPYGVGPRCYARLIVGRERYNADGFVPDGCAIMPEGWAHTFQQTETLMRLLAPGRRSEHPAGVEHFEHYITEHGFSPAELGIHDPAAADRAKQKFLLRASLLWLNKGLTGFYVFNTFDPREDQFGVLLHDGGVSPALQALHRLVSHLGSAAAEAQTASRPASALTLDARVQQLSGPRGVYENDPEGRHVAQRQLVAVLPFSLGAHRLAVAVYVMTENFPQDLEPQNYRLTLTGLGAGNAAASCYDPIDDRSVPVHVSGHTGGAVSVDVELTDAPRLLEIDT
jgi:hypothetical protein